MKAPLYNQKGEKMGEVLLSKDIFEIEVNMGLVHEALLRQNAHARQGTAKALTRANVRGGGRKPYKQKGTGRARQGSIRAPHYRGGGVVFGPTGLENHTKQMNKKMRRKALFSSLSLQAKEEGVLVLDSFLLKEPKTKEFIALLKCLPEARRVLVVAPEKDEILIKSVSNIPFVKFLTAGYLNVADILNADLVIFLESALKKTEEIFLS